ncbi:lipopolysaccharide biosynthesis protein [Frateuria soli]|uniref:lipopolysaccharide biosynthesis protein n=1 Tax=Frateuria soli TaxID=1542730 RepID=UPI001E5496A2|nr:hypothetical protein [Frateuria soli]UGB38278.1 hypothetical protein LQ771_00005 [Frateuria soli]
MKNAAQIGKAQSMDITITRRLLKGFSANAYGQTIAIAVQLVGVPLLLHAWGAQLYGEWLILFAIPAYFAITDLGFAHSAGNDIAARVSRRDQQGALTVFQSLATLLYLVSSLGLALSVAVIWNLPFEKLWHFQAISPGEAKWVLCLLVAQVFAGLLNGVCHAGFYANGDYALHIALNGTSRLVQFSGVWLAASLGSGPVVAAAIFLAVRAIATLACAILLIYRHRWLRFSVASAKVAELRRLLKPAMANTAVPLAQALNIQGMVLVVGAVLGPLAVVVFSTLRTLTRLTVQLIAAVSNAAEPELAAAFGAGNQNLMQILFIHILRAGIWMAFICAAGLAILGESILNIWTHGRVHMDSKLFAWLLASAMTSVLWYGALIVLKATNRHVRAALIYVLAAALALAAAYLLLTRSGDLTNAGLAVFSMDVVMAIYVMRASTSLLGTRPAASLLLAANPRPLVVTVLRRALPVRG